MNAAEPANNRSDSFLFPPLVEDYFPKRSVGGLVELECLLAYWYEKSSRATIADVGKYGGTPHITVEMLDQFALNRDTTRSAVAEFLTAARAAGGAEKLRWHVVRNARGRINKVTYRSDDVPPRGWFAFLRTPADTPRDLR